MKNTELMGSICAAFAATALMAAGAHAQPLPETLEVVQAEVTSAGVSLTLRTTETTGPAVVGVRTLEGGLIGEAAFAIAPGTDETVVLPLPGGALGASLRLDLELAGARRVAGLSVMPHCTVGTGGDGVTEAFCNQVATVTDGVSNAFPFSDDARTVFDTGILEQDGFGGLDGFPQAVIGEVIRYSETTTEPVDVGECSCDWTLFNSDGVKVPAVEQKGAESWDDNWLHYAYLVGPGAVLDADLKHDRDKVSVYRRNGEKSPAGSTARVAKLDCWTVVAHEIVRIYEHIPPNAPVLIEERIYPVHGDERCNGCPGVVDYIVLGHVDANATADRKGTSLTWGDAESTLVGTVAGQSMNLEAEAFAHDCFGCGADTDDDDDSGVLAGTTGAPLSLSIDADLHLEVEGDGKDKATASASASYGYAFTAVAGCGASDLLVFESASHNGWEPDFCHEIEDFFGQRGFSVDCD